MPIYLQYEGIDGDVSAEGHEKWIEVQSMTWGIGRGITKAGSVGGNAEREASAPSVSELTLSKMADTASAKLMQESLWGEGKKVKIDLVKTDKDKLEAYQQYELENTMISGFSVSSGGDRPMESLTLNFTKIIFSHIPMKDKNETGSPEKVGYDLAKAKSI
jgi:type VI secretion system secreted protein Hcp